MANTKPLNNMGGRTLIGNYAEERFLSETMGINTDCNKKGENASLSFANGNSDLLSRDKSMMKTSMTKDSYVGAAPVAVPVGRRALLAAEAAKQAAAAEYANEVNEAAARDAPGVLMSTQQTDFGASQTKITCSAVGDDSVDSSAPMTFWSSTHQRQNFHRSAAFTAGYNADELIATGQL
eukprot:m.164907 g.164907  ORF g.164907 m.164907 type:complete len:180 (-) comp18116_c0_seq2:423-962(-)